MGRISRRADPRRGKIKSRDEPVPQPKADDRPPVFSFEYLQKGWCIADCQPIERSKMLDRIRMLSELSWSELRQQDRHKLGTETLPFHAIKGAKIPAFVTPDVKLLAFRAWEKVAMVGYKDDRVFYVLWIDREFKLYNH